VVLTIALCLFAGCVTSPRKAPTPPAIRHTPSSELSVGTYNIFIGTRDVTHTVAVIRRMDADIVALQEVSPENAVVLGRELSRTYRYRYFSSGLGIVSRFPLRHPHFERSRHGINGFLFAEVATPRGRLQIANLHLDPLRIWTAPQKLTLPLQVGRQHEIHRDELDQAMANLRPGLPVILLGDFNRASNAAIDKLRAMGFEDSFATVTPHADRNSTLHFSVLGFRTGRRVDFIFHDHAFHTLCSEVLPGRPSDHDAVVSRLGWSKR
jgi:endonuclease/exonuclease/phosphatase family metal-dependent hydrolase